MQILPSSHHRRHGPHLLEQHRLNTLLSLAVVEEAEFKVVAVVQVDLELVQAIQSLLEIHIL